MNYYPPPVPYQQYNNAYPTLYYQQPPCAANGYGWHGNGYGWQLDPAAWRTPPLYPSIDQPVVAVEEPKIESQKVQEVNAWSESRRSSKIEVDESFIKNVATIIEATSLSARKEKLDELLRNISAVQVGADRTKPTPKVKPPVKPPIKPGVKPAVKPPVQPPVKPPIKPPVKPKLSGWWPMSKGKGNTGKVLPQKPSPYTRNTSMPFFNKSFYHYKAKSRTEGLTFRPHRVYYYGEKGSGFQAKSGTQDYYELRDQCLANGSLFEDSEFPPTNSSLFYTHKPDRHYEWKRPGEIVDNPQLFVEGFSRFDVQQGELGDCWLLAAVANLTLYRRLFFQIVPDDQSFEENYAGIFHFRFWQYGRWVDVVIDDRLPTFNGQLIFLHSTEENEFWSALLEKAYAKLHGSYEALKGGSTCEAMEDMTGGVTEMYELNSAPPNLFKIIAKAYERLSLMGCSIEVDENYPGFKLKSGIRNVNDRQEKRVAAETLSEDKPSTKRKWIRPDPDILEAQTPEGLVRGHAYSITKVQYVDIRTPNTSGKIPLLRLRNPWGNESEWNGAWSDNSPEWQFISEDQKQELGLNFDADGEFWMSFKDFQRYFQRLEICNLNPDSLTEDELTTDRNKKWVMSVFEGEWVRGVTAGGCRNFLNTFYHNPQYRITLEEVDEGDDEDKCTLIVGLMQKNRRQMRRSGGVDLLTIGFAIYYLPYPDRAPKPLDLNFFKFNASVARAPSFINLREVSCRFKLPKGTYCIVPSTFDPNEEGEFLLRVFSEHQNNMEENDQQIGFTDAPPTLHGTLTSTEAKENELILQLFKNVAGKDEEVDWKELKEILDFYTKKEEEAIAMNVEGVGAAPGTVQPDTTNLLTAILALICGRLCKDTQLAEAVQASNQEHNLSRPYSETKSRGFSKDVCRSMIAMLDTDRTGKLNFGEFKRLWTSIRIWKNVFKQYDKNQSGTLTGFELREALTSAGYTLNSAILNILMHRYGNKDGEIEFDDFIMCAVKLKIMIELFKEVASPTTNNATFTLDDWIENTLYA